MNLTIKQAHQGLIKKEFSALELAKDYLKKIKKIDKEISAFLTVLQKSALSQAKQIDAMIAQGQKIPVLAGIPLAVKDNILVEGERCTTGSKILQNYVAPYDATVVRKLKEQQAVILGKTNMDEFALGSSCGSAAAVAADMAVYALGSDTGGSIRLPAHLGYARPQRCSVFGRAEGVAGRPACFCGVVGLKPTYGAVSRYGLMAMASSLDQIGPITKSVEDAKIVFDVIKGKDEMDSTSVEFKNQESRIKNQELRVGIPKEYFIEGIDKEVEGVIKNAIKKFEELGAKTIEISLPYTKYALACYYLIMPAEVSANLARYDGIRFGYFVNKSDALLDVYLQSREQGFGEEVRRRIMLGTYVLSTGYYEAYYLKAQKVRTLIKQDFAKAFEKVDVILTPVSPTPAVSVNLAGLPAISIPAGPVRDKVSNGAGIQLIGKPFEESVILAAGQVFEKSQNSAAT